VPYVVALTRSGWREALRADAALAQGLSAHEGQLASAEVGAAHGIEVAGTAELLA
jgi:alanine dehydrogenase